MRRHVESWMVAMLMVLAFVAAAWPALAASTRTPGPPDRRAVVCSDRRSPACGNAHNPNRVQPNGRPIPYRLTGGR